MSKDNEHVGRFEDLYAKVINSVANPIFLKDRQHTWIFLNDAFCQFLGVDREELLGKSDFDYFPKDQAEVFWSKDDLVLSSGQTNINEEEFTNSRGEHFTILTSKVRVKDENGDAFILGTITDVTEMKSEEVQMMRKSIQISAQKQEIENIIQDLGNYQKENLDIISGINTEFYSDVIVEAGDQSIGSLESWINTLSAINDMISFKMRFKRLSLAEFLNQLILSQEDLEKKINPTISGDSVILPMREMTILGMIVIQLLRYNTHVKEELDVWLEILYNERVLELEYVSQLPLVIAEERIENSTFFKALAFLAQRIGGKIEVSSRSTRFQLMAENIHSLKRGAR